MPYGYYMLVRYFAAVIFTVIAYQFYNGGYNATAIFFVVLTILFQPILKIALGKRIWNVIDAIVAIILVIMVLYGKIENKKSI